MQKRHATQDRYVCIHSIKTTDPFHRVSHKKTLAHSRCPERQYAFMLARPEKLLEEGQSMYWNPTCWLHGLHCWSSSTGPSPSRCDATSLEDGWSSTFERQPRRQSMALVVAWSCHSKLSKLRPYVPYPSLDSRRERSGQGQRWRREATYWL